VTKITTGYDLGRSLTRDADAYEVISGEPPLSDNGQYNPQTDTFTLRTPLGVMA